jgi:hypothetical protein
MRVLLVDSCQLNVEGNKQMKLKYYIILSADRPFQ